MNVFLAELLSTIGMLLSAGEYIQGRSRWFSLDAAPGIPVIPRIPSRSGRDRVTHEPAACACAAKEPKRAYPKRARGSFIVPNLFDQSLHLADQRGELPPLGDRLGGETPVLESMVIALRRTGRGAAVHPTAPVHHRWRLARRPGPRPGSATRAQVHGQSALHGVVPGTQRTPGSERPSQ
jgi:hypothetical protein